MFGSTVEKPSSRIEGCSLSSKHSKLGRWEKILTKSSDL